jgi:estrogen-related receptor beta like 1
VCSKQTEEDKQQYEQVLSKVNELTNNLASISDELEEVKNRMEDRGSSMTDASPVVSMKKSLSQVTN